MKKILQGGPTRAYWQTLCRWTANSFLSCKQELADKTRMEAHMHTWTDNMQFLVWPVHRTFARQ